MSPPPPPNTPTPVTFSSLLPMTQTTSHTYTVNLSDDWCIGTVPNGGYITSAFLIAARTHMTLTHPTRHCPHPINLHLQFLRRTASGPATFLVEDIKLGTRISNLHLTLQQHRDPNDPSTPIQNEVQGYITLTNLSTESGLSQTTQHHLLPPPVPVNLTALSSNSDENYILRRPDPHGSFRRAALHCDMHLIKPSRRPKAHTPAIADQWVRFRPLTSAPKVEDLKRNTLTKCEGRWTNDALGYVVDIFPQLNDRFMNQAIEDALLTPRTEISDEEVQGLVKGERRGDGERPSKTYWYPTLLLNLDVKKLLPEEGVEWLFVRIQAKKIEKGRFDLSVEVWDSLDCGEEGLVAISTHASLILDAGRNTKRSPKTKKESKM